MHTASGRDPERLQPIGYLKEADDEYSRDSKSEEWEV